MSEENVEEKTIVIGGKKFRMGHSVEADLELKELAEIVRLEGQQYQPKKQGICLFMLLCVILMNLLVPSPSSPSIIGIESCSQDQYTLQCVFLLTCLTVTVVAVRLNQRE